MINLSPSFPMLCLCASPVCVTCDFSRWLLVVKCFSTFLKLRQLLVCFFKAPRLNKILMWSLFGEADSCEWTSKFEGKNCERNWEFKPQHCWPTLWGGGQAVWAGGWTGWAGSRVTPWRWEFIDVCFSNVKRPPLDPPRLLLSSTKNVNVLALSREQG